VLVLAAPAFAWVDLVAWSVAVSFFVDSFASSGGQAPQSLTLVFEKQEAGVVEITFLVGALVGGGVGALVCALVGALVGARAHLLSVQTPVSQDSGSFLKHSDPVLKPFLGLHFMAYELECAQTPLAQADGASRQST